MCGVSLVTALLGVDALLHKQLQGLEQQLGALFLVLELVGHIHQRVHHRLVHVAEEGGVWGGVALG